MELPQLGDHCSVQTCNRLDFLPMRCDACQSTVCKDHIQYDAHQCSSAYRKNVQIPVCPLCNQAVPYTYRDQSPDRVVSAHIDRDCKSDPAIQKRAKIYSNKCSVPACKQREAISVKCERCTRTFCLRHRFPDDHRCQEFSATNQPERPPTKNEDPSLALAMKLSLNQTTQEENDFLLAKALQESEQEEARRRRTPATTTAAVANRSEPPTDKKSCSIQ